MESTRILIALLGTLLVSPLLASSPPARLADLLKPSTVLVLGERHHRPESPQLFTQLVESYLASDRCLTIGLEIRSDQQPALDRALAGEAPMATVEIFQGIDHSAYRDMLEQLAILRRAGRCISVHALDAPVDAAESRDEWMAGQVETLVDRQHGVLILVGNNHALKKVRWKPAVSHLQPYLAERLMLAGIDVLSVLQRWSAGECGPRHPEMMPVHSPVGGAAVEQTMRILAAHPPTDAAEVADWVIMWECSE